MALSEEGRRLLQNEFTTFEAKQNQRVAKAEQAIKLSVITQYFPPDYAATGQLVEELVRELGILGVDIEVFTGQPGYAFGTTNAPATEKNGRVKIKRSRTSQMFPGRIRGKALNGVMFFIRSLSHLIRHARSHNLLLVTTAPPFLPLIGYLAHLLLGISYVCILYDLYPDIAVALNVIPKHHFLTRFWMNINRRVWRNASCLIVLSPDMKQRVVNNCPEVADKVTVIHSWADSDLIVPMPKKYNWFAWKHNLVDKFTVLYSGNMGRCHDMDTILEAAKELQDEPIHFLFVGSGAKGKILKEDVKRLGLHNIQFLPYQDKEDLPYSLTACDVSLVSVDQGMESLVAPSKVYGALAAGRPMAIICPQHSYLQDMMAEINCGGAFNNGDSSGLADFLRHLNRDKQLAEKMGKSAREYMRSHFTSKEIAKQYLKALQKAMVSK
ncbi:MAG: glycosyltransferase family 4 protein [Methylacidiphilales bacterium]|nr:glycosyltransferase family 4 protein [Candidatus Methylacidiphilales bacterium]NJR18519.1 glycosyltransferase family 4 protein [Calothrix sp. CSU_2_0]